MQESFQQIVDEDTAEAWSEVKKQMPWANIDKGDGAKLAELGFRDSEIDHTDEDEIEALISSSEEGSVWGEFYLDPIISIGDDFDVYIKNCQYVSPLRQTPSLSNLEGIYVSERAWTEGLPTSAISYLLIVCPRCQLLATGGDQDVDFDPEEDESFIDEDCPACSGTGEWEYELL